MGDRPEAFLFFVSYHDAAKALPPCDQGEFYRIIVDYVFDGAEPDCTGALKACFELSRPMLDKYLERSRSGSKGGSSVSKAKAEAARRNGAKGGRPAETPDKPKLNPSKTQAKPKLNPTYKDKDKDKDKEEKKDIAQKARASFTPPTVEQIKAYCTEKGYTFDAESFHAYYESNGWRVGRNPMRSWKAACRTWQGREPVKEVPDEFKIYDGAGVRALWDASQA